MPKGPFNGAVLEDRLIRQMDAERECLEILRAVELLEEREKKIIQLAYISATQYTNYKIGQELQYSERTIERFKSEALIQFAYAYKMVSYLCGNKKSTKLPLSASWIN